MNIDTVTDCPKQERPIRILGVLQDEEKRKKTYCRIQEQQAKVSAY